jgi:hypothetical protein
LCILSTIGVFAAEEDVSTYTIKAVDDAKTLNKILYLRPPSNTLSHNELVSLWEKKVGKTIERVYIPEDEVLKKIQGHSTVNVFFAWLSYVIIFSFASDRMTVPFFY